MDPSFSGIAIRSAMRDQHWSVTSSAITDQFRRKCFADMSSESHEAKTLDDLS